MCRRHLRATGVTKDWQAPPWFAPCVGRIFPFRCHPQLTLGVHQHEYPNQDDS